MDGEENALDWYVYLIHLLHFLPCRQCSKSASQYLCHTQCYYKIHLTLCLLSLRSLGDEITDRFKELVGRGAKVVTQSEAEFDPRNQYEKIIRMVKEAGNGTAVIFKVQDDHTRAIYFITSLDERAGRLVGLKAMAVES